MTALRILVADDHEIVRRGVCAMLRSHLDWEVCGEAGDGWTAVEETERLRPDVVILDLRMPRLNGLDAAREILRKDLGARLLILTVIDSQHAIDEALSIGVHGFVLKSDAGQDLVRAIEALQLNRTFFSPAATNVMEKGCYGSRNVTNTDRDRDIPRLTARERQIVQLLAEGRHTKEAAAVLNISPKTAEKHRSNIMRKLKFHSASELVLYAVRNNMVETRVFDTQAPGSGSGKSGL